MSVRAMLEAPEKLRRSLGETEARLEAMESAASAVTARLSAAPGGGGEGREALWAAVSDLRAEAEAQRQALAAAEARLDAFLVRFRAQFGLRPYALLRWRCRLGKDWAAVSREIAALYGKRLSLRTVKVWYEEAVADAETMGPW